MRNGFAAVGASAPDSHPFVYMPFVALAGLGVVPMLLKGCSGDGAPVACARQRPHQFCLSVSSE